VNRVDLEQKQPIVKARKSRARRIQPSVEAIGVLDEVENFVWTLHGSIECVERTFFDA
jgi:hypothetical protein